MSATIVEMEEYCRKLFSLTEVGYRGERLRLLKLINGDAFFALKEWTSVTKTLFFRKPLSDVNTLVLLLFLVGTFLFMLKIMERNLIYNNR